MAQAPLQVPLLLLLLLVTPAYCLSTAAPTTLPLYRHLPQQVAEETTTTQHPLSRLAAASLARASHLKRHSSSSSSHQQQQPHGAGGVGTTATALYPHSYGGYAFTVSLGTPAQQVPVLLDTGSHLSWVPCTSKYECRNCSSSDSSSFPTFIPKRSSTSRLVGCRNPSCLWVHSSSKLSSSSNKCGNNNTNGVCPPYAVIYGSGSTAGLLIADTLRASPGSSLKKNFIVGCSLVSVHQPPSGLAGFGRGAPSMPAQLGLKKFSYCLLSRRFDDNAAVSGQLVLGGGTGKMQYVPFVVHESNEPPYSVYYYLALTGITVGGKPVRLPQRAFTSVTGGPGGRGGGGGGAIIDSGTTFTYLDPTVFQPVAAAVVAAVGGRYIRSREVEDGLGLRPCFALPNNKSSSMELPELSLQFKGGAQMKLPLANYFVAAGRGAGVQAICLAVITDIANGGGPVAGGGPAIILGSFQQQNYLIEYDLHNNRLGFRRQPCASSA